MKALDEYFLVVVFTLLLNKVHVFTNFIFNLNRDTSDHSHFSAGHRECFCSWSCISGLFEQTLMLPFEF